MDKEIEMLAGIVKYLVENEDEIRIQKNEETDGSTNLILTTHKDDIGRVIGKEGKVVGAMRTLLRVLGAKLDKRITLTVIEPDKI
ncbi:KH domain-containing protein [Candidatus Gracilibacteria bacterium]|nr:KH domain-containing protein [Candidatus Gracilibacteria bacterium]